MFLAFALLTISSAIAMAFQRNVVIAGLFLVATFIGVSGLYILLSNPVSAALQIMVYAGAILVLVLFVIMMLNSHDEEPPERSRYFQTGASIVIGLVILLLMIYGATSSSVVAALNAATPKSNPVTLNQMGNLLMRNYIIPFETIGLILLASMIASISLVKRQL